MTSSITQPTTPLPADAAGEPAPTTAALPPPGPASAPQAFSLKQRIMRGAFWTIFGQVVTQVMRFGSNLLLTRLLAPDIFGLMTMAFLVLFAVEMLTGMGVPGSIISHKRGEDPRFLSTTWTVKVIRGTALAALAMLLAPIVAYLYGQPQLLPVVIVLSLTLLIRGFESTARFTLARRLQPRWYTTMDLKAEALGIAVTLVLAWYWHSLWPMVIGAVLKETVRMLLSHRLIPGYRVWFAYEKEAARDLWKFGRWVAISSGVAFLLMQGDKLVLAKVLTATELGIYGLAVLLVSPLDQIMVQLGEKVMQPTFARLASRDLPSVRRNVARARMALLAAFLPAAWFLAIFGDRVVQLLYDPRWLGAGWPLQLLAMAMVPRIIGLSTDGVLLARGDSYRQMQLQMGRAALLVAAIAIGLPVAGLDGLLIGLVIARVAEYPLMVGLIRKYGIWLPSVDLGALVISMAAIAAGWAVRAELGW